MKIAVASDHAGFEYKEAIRVWLDSQGHQVTDFGTFGTEAVDYPDFIRPAAEAVARGDCERGIVLGGSGNGEAIAANKSVASAARSAGTRIPRASPASTTMRTSCPSGSA